MKRILSIIITVAMLLTSINAFAIEYSAGRANADVLDSDFAAQTIGNFKSSTGKGAVNASGMFGKAVDDVSGLYEDGTGAYYYIRYMHGEPIYMDNGVELDGKLVVEFNFKPVNNDFKFAQIAISERQHNASEQITPTTAGFNPYGWNHVKWIYDPTGHGDFSQKGSDGKYVIEDGAVLGTTVTYLNSVQLGTAAKTITNVNSDDDRLEYTHGASDVLIQVFSGDKVNSHSAYIDDIKIYKDAAPAAPAPAVIGSGSTYVVDGYNITTSADTTVADIKAANPALEIVAYEDNAFATVIADDAVLEVDNFIVTKSADGVYGTYCVADPMAASYLVNIDDGVISGTGISTPRLAITQVGGIGGKPTNDVAARAEFANTANGTDYNGYISIQSYTNTDPSKYYVAEFNVYLDTATNLFMATSQNVAVVKGVGTDVLGTKKWSKVAIVMDYSGDYPVGRLFVNDAEVAAAKCEHSDSAKKIFGVNATEIRIGFPSSASTNNVAYFDDIKIYETDVMPTAELTTAPKLVSNDKVTIDDDVINTTLGTTVADLETDIVSKIYASVDGVATDALTDGTEVAVIGKNDAIRVYTVAIEAASSELLNVASYADYTAAKISSPRANTEEALGFGGKDATDSAIKFAQVGTPEKADSSHYDWYIQHSWGTATKPTDTEPSVWDKADYVGYFVYEADIYNQSLASMRFVTDQGSQISGGFSLETGSWNKVHLIVNQTGDANDGKAIVYVNGEVAADWVEHTLGTEHSSTKIIKNAIRFSANGLKIEKDKDYSDVTDFGTAYLDNIKMYETNVMPQVKEEEAVTGIIADGTPSKLVRGVVTTVPGFAGKSEDNEVSKIVLTEDANENTAYSELIWSRVLENSKYIVIESDIYSESNYGGAYYATSQHSPLGGNYSNANGIMGADKWNRYVVVLDIENDYTANVYINGVLVGEDVETSFMTTYNDGKSIRNAIRTVYPLEKGEATYLDNYKVYETNVYPEISESPVAANGVYANGVLTDNYLYVKAGTTVDDAAAIMGPGTFVYTDSTLATEELESAEVYNGLVAAVVDADNDLYYSRKIVVIDEVPAVGDSQFTILGADNGSTMEPVTVVANMLAGDVFVMKQDIVQNVTDAEGAVAVKEDTGTRKLIIAEEDGIVLSTIVPQAENGKLRAFMFDNLTSIRPLGGQTVIECPFPVVDVEAE